MISNVTLSSAGYLRIELLQTEFVIAFKVHYLAHFRQKKKTSAIGENIPQTLTRPKFHVYFLSFQLITYLSYCLALNRLQGKHFDGNLNALASLIKVAKRLPSSFSSSSF